MTPGTRLVIGFLFVIAGAIHCSKAVPSGPDENPEMKKLVLEAQTLARDRKKPQAAIEKCDKVIAHYKAAYGNLKVKIYCARNSIEEAAYMFRAAAGLPGTSGKGYDAIALSSTWSDAYYMKAYALQDMGRIAEAKSALKQALELSPWDSYCWSELGSIYQVEKNWQKAKESFEQAEAEAQKSPDDIKARDLARARRGVGYVLVELGRLDEAEKKYKQCLATNPKDTKAAQELEYVRGLRAKTKSH